MTDVLDDRADAADAGFPGSATTAHGTITVPATPTLELAGGMTIPQLGFGTYKIAADQTQRCVEEALELGYRLIDTATAYGNEAGVGAALAATGLAQQTVVITKLPNYLQGYEPALRAFEASRKALRLDVVDLYLIHWPCPSQDRYVETWRAFRRLRDEGAVRAIGVSNFLPEHLERLLAETGELPALNQIESHPSWWQPQTDAWCRDHQVAVGAYAPLGRGGDMTVQAVLAAAEAHRVTAAQVILRWHVQMGHVAIPKSAHPDRMAQNLDVCGFSLAADEMTAISALGTSAPNRLCGDPRTFELGQTPEEMARRMRR